MVIREPRIPFPEWWAGEEARDLPVMLRQAAAGMEAAVRRGAADSRQDLDGVSFSALIVLRTLVVAPRRPMVLARGLQMSDQGMRKTLRSLEDRGFVTCAPSWQHEGGLVAALTDEGSRAAAEVNGTIDDVLSDFADGLPVQLIELLVIALRLMNAPDADTWIEEFQAVEELLRPWAEEPPAG